MISITAKRKEIDKEVLDSGFNKVEQNVYERDGIFYKQMFHKPDETDKNKVTIYFCEMEKDELM